MAKIIVLGSHGQLGSDLIKVLNHSGLHQIVAATRSDVNASNSMLASELAKYSDSDYIVNCIATTNVDGCEDNSATAFQINSVFVIELAKFCQQNAITLIHISTDYVFDGTKNTPYTEDDQPNPLNVYGLSKLAGELAVKNYAKKYFIFRVSSLFGVGGASGKGGNFITTMLRLANEKESWTVINDQLTCPTHTLDVARAIEVLIQSQIKEYGIYHCVSNSSCSWFEFAQQILAAAGKGINKILPVSYKEYNFKAKRPQVVIMSTKKLSKYYIMPSYQIALAEFLELKNRN